jgi:hypothetical protein
MDLQRRPATQRQRTSRTTRLTVSEREALARLLRAVGQPVGSWIAVAYQAAPATVLGAAVGLPVKPGTAELLRRILREAGQPKSDVEKGAT